jgi:hypothetical protein
MADDLERARQHILPTAGTMLGICTTLIGLVKLLEGRLGPSHVDEIGGLVGTLFLFSALASYGAIRTEQRTLLSRQLERTADACFLVALLSLTLLSLLFAYELL